MRYLIRRIIWTRRILIFFILVIILFIFINLKIEKLRENIRYDLEKALSEATGEQVNIGLISGGLRKGFSCESISISSKDKSGNKILLKSGNLYSNLSFLNLIFSPSKISKIKLKISSLYLYPNSKSFSLVKKLAFFPFNNFSYVSDNLLKTKLLKILRLNFPKQKIVDIEFSNVKMISNISPILDNFKGNILIDSEYINFNSTAKLFTGIKIDINGIVNKTENNYSKIALKFHNPDINGEISIFGEILSPSVEGYMSIFNVAKNLSTRLISRKYLVKGDINFHKKFVQLKIKPDYEQHKTIYLNTWPYPENRSIEFSSDFSNWPIFKFYIHHIMLGNLDLSTNISLKLLPRFDKAVNMNMDKEVCMYVATSGTIINFMPYEELTAELIFLDDKIELRKLEIGENVLGKGSIYLKNKLNLTFLLNAFSLEEFKNIFLPSLIENRLSGIVDATVKVKGDLYHPKWLISIKGKNGWLADMQYDKIILEVKGVGSKFEILDGAIYTDKKKYKVKGDINISKKENEQAGNIELKSPDRSSFIFEKWQISTKENNEIDLTRNLGEDLRLRFTTGEIDEVISQPKDSDKFEIEYKLSQDESLKIQLKDEEGIVGIQKSLEF